MDFGKKTVKELKEYLRSIGKPTTGLKADLVKIATLYHGQQDQSDQEAHAKTQAALEEERKIFDDKLLAWKDVMKQKPNIPGGFNIDVIFQFLTKDMTFDASGNTLDAGTEKPSIRGRQLYIAAKFQLCQFSKKGDKLLFRATTEASMNRDEFYHPCLGLSNAGKIITSKCSCKQRTSGQCSHVGGLCYLIEDLSFGRVPIISTPSTSKPQYWGQGIKTNKNPQPLPNLHYGKKKFRANELANFDPRPRKSTDDEIRARRDTFLRSLQSSKSESAWEDILKFDYEDFPLTTEDLNIIQYKRNLAIRFMEERNLCHDGELLSRHSDILSNQSAIHITGIVNYVHPLNLLFLFS